MSENVVIPAAAEESPSAAVVVPIYNVEQYLSECLGSVAAQTLFHRLQVVLVDDGSTDDSGGIADAFAAGRPNVSVVHQENRGLGAARNRGLQEVTAPFVTFLDGADRLAADGVATLLQALREEDADVVVGGVVALGEGAVVVERMFEPRVVDGIEHAHELLTKVSACGKLFRTAALREIDAAFGEDTAFEDAYLSVPALLATRRLVTTGAPVYHRRKRTVPVEQLWSDPKRYWDQLALIEFLSALRQTVPGHRRRALDLLLVRTFQGFALRAPEFLPETQLRVFFRRAADVFDSMDPRVIKDACPDAKHRIAFVAFCLRDWKLFADRSAALSGVQAVEGRLRLTLDREIPDLLQCLLVASRVTAHIESLDCEDDGATLRVRGRFEIDGLPLLAQVPCALGVRVRGSDIYEPAQNVRRHIASAKKITDDWSGFVCDLPSDQLRTGQHQLRLVFTTDTGPASAAMRPANGALRAARTLPLSDRRVILLKRGKAAVVRVQVGTGRLARVLWWGRGLVDDLRQAKARRPFWRARLLRMLTAPFFPHGVWILGERRDTAQDNSYVLFRYLREHRPDIRAYYLMDSDSEHMARVRPLGRVVAHSSRLHRLLMLHARVLVNSYDLDSYLLPRQWHAGKYLQHLAWRVGSRRVFLQHGVTYNNVSATLHRGVTGLDLFVTASEREAEAVRAGMGFTTQVAVTGMPRFDRLNRGPVGRRILVMPTWRRDLVLPSYRRDRPGVASRDVMPFESSAYATFWRSLLNDAPLLDLLERSDTTLEFFAHYEMDEVAGTLAPEHPRVQISRNSNRSVQEAILDCSLFVTDWSSTFFDAAYAGRPLVMVPFDEVEFRRTQYAKGYFDFDRDGFGPVARSVEDALTAIAHYVRTDFEREQRFEERVRSFFVHRDTRNCERVVEGIARALSGQPASVVPVAPEPSAESVPMPLVS